MLSVRFSAYPCVIVFAGYIMFYSGRRQEVRKGDRLIRIMNETFCISIKISPKFVSKGPIDKNTAKV